MILSEAHQSDLESIGKRGLATLASVILFWGTTAVTFFPDSDVFDLSLYSGAISAVVIIGCFSSSYQNLLPEGITTEQRRLGFILFWFTGSFGFNLCWRLPYWALPFINKAPKTVDGFWWKLIWWSYTFHDSWYEASSGFVIAVETWRILCSLVSGLGLYRYYRYRTILMTTKKSTAETEELFVKSCLLFLLSGTLQFSNSVMYILLTVSRHQYVQRPLLGQIILWSFNGFSLLASAFAVSFSYSVILWNQNRQSMKRQSSR